MSQSSKTTSEEISKLLGVSLDASAIADQKRILERIRQETLQGADLDRQDRNQGGSENTLFAVNFTLAKTLKNLKHRYGHLVASRAQWDKCLEEIFAYLLNHSNTIEIEGKNRHIALEGAWYYSHKNTTQDWNKPSHWDPCPEYSIPYTLYLWWQAAQDNSENVRKYSSVWARKRAFCGALEDVIRSYNRDNEAGVDDRATENSPACRQGFKNKLAESFKEITGARHPDNTFFPDLVANLRDMGRRFLIEEFRKLEPKQQEEFRKGWKEGAEKLISETREKIQKRFNNYIPTLGEPETEKERRTLKIVVKDILDCLGDYDLPVSKNIEPSLSIFNDTKKTQEAIKLQSIENFKKETENLVNIKSDADKDLSKQTHLENPKISIEETEGRRYFISAVFHTQGFEDEVNIKKGIEHFLISARYNNIHAQYVLAGYYAHGYGNIITKDLMRAAEYDKLAAEQGCVEAQFSMGFYYSHGYGVDKDLQIAFKWVEKAAKQEYDKAQNLLGSYYERGIGTLRDPLKAAEFYRLAAQQGNNAAQFNLGVCFDNGNGVVKNHKQAVDWYKLAADQEHEEAQFELGVCYEHGKTLEKDINKAIECYKLAVRGGSAKAQFCLANHYRKGDIVEKNLDRAFELYEFAAEQEHVKAQLELGTCYAQGQGVEKDPQKAAEYYELAAKASDAEAQYYLGICYQQGNGLDKDLKKAIYWLELSAKQGFTEAQVNLALFYLEGNGAARDVKKAIEYYELAEKKGLLPAELQFKLGVCYEQGSGLSKDPKRAVELYELAAQQGHSGAKCNLGICYMQGHGGVKDPEKAIILLKSAVRKKYAHAQYILGTYYLKGIGVAKNPKIAMKLFNLAEAQGIRIAASEKVVQEEQSQKPSSTIDQGASNPTTTYISSTTGLPVSDPDNLVNAKEFCIQAKNNDVASMRDFLNFHPGFNISTPFQAGFTALHYACKYKSLEAAQFLITLGADATQPALDKNKTTPLNLCKEDKIFSESLNKLIHMLNTQAKSNFIFGNEHISRERMDRVQLGKLSYDYEEHNFISDVCIQGDLVLPHILHSITGENFRLVCRTVNRGPVFDAIFAADEAAQVHKYLISAGLPSEYVNSCFLIVTDLFSPENSKKLRAFYENPLNRHCEDEIAENKVYRERIEEARTSCIISLASPDIILKKYYSVNPNGPYLFTEKTDAESQMFFARKNHKSIPQKDQSKKAEILAKEARASLEKSFGKSRPNRTIQTNNQNDSQIKTQKAASYPEDLLKRQIVNLESLIAVLKKCQTSQDGQILPTPELAFRRAAAKGNVDILTELVKMVKDLDINSRGRESGKTALDFARDSGNKEAMQFLICFGATSGLERTEPSPMLASENEMAVNRIIETLRPLFQAWKIDHASSFVSLIASYAKPIGREMLTVFNEEEVQKLFPEQLLLFRKFRLEKESPLSSENSTSSLSTIPTQGTDFPCSSKEVKENSEPPARSAKVSSDLMTTTTLRTSTATPADALPNTQSTLEHSAPSSSGPLSEQQDLTMQPQAKANLKK